MNFDIWDILRTGHFNIPVPRINIRQMMMEEHMNFLDFIHLPSWVPFALWGLGAVLVLIALGALKSLIGWRGVVAVLFLAVLIGGEVDGARRTLDHYKVKTPWLIAIPGIFL